MEKIPTAEEFFADLQRYDHQEHIYGPSAEQRAIEFAKLHVEAALKAAAKTARSTTRTASDGYECWQVEEIDDNSILDAYPLDNIK